MKRLGQYMLKYWYRYVFGMACLLISVILDNRLPIITKSIVDDVITAGQTEKLMNLLLSILGIGIGRMIFQFCKEYTFDMIGADVCADMRKDLFHHVSGLSQEFYNRTNTGEIMARIKNDCETIWGGVGFIGMLLFEIIFHLTLVIINMIMLSPKLAIFPICMIPIIGAMAIFLEKKLDSIYDELSEQNATINTTAQEDIAGVRTVKAFAREKFEIEKFAVHNKKYYELAMKQSKALVRYEPLFQLVSGLVPVVMLLFGGYMVINDEITLGTLAAFIAYCDYLVWPLENIGWCGNEFASMFASYKKVKKLASEEASIVSPENPVVLPEVKGGIEFNNVSFSIGDKDILKNVSFKLPAGKTLGIMGATGSGKSSILTILGRFYDPGTGVVKLDSVDIKELSLSQLRSSISQVSQEVFLFSDTVKQNVKFGERSGISDEDIKKSMAMACADEFVSRLAEGDETVIGERGVGLSGGQKQRLSIARALSKNAPILVLDDSTSALDTETEHEIQEALKKLNCTKIIIGHRISAVKNADEIIVLNEGEIAERGTHEELLKKKGLYFETYTTQFGITNSPFEKGDVVNG